MLTYIGGFLTAAREHLLESETTWTIPSFLRIFGHGWCQLPGPEYRLLSPNPKLCGLAPCTEPSFRLVRSILVSHVPTLKSFHGRLALVLLPMGNRGRTVDKFYMRRCFLTVVRNADRRCITLLSGHSWYPLHGP